MDSPTSKAVVNRPLERLDPDRGPFLGLGWGLGLGTEGFPRPPLRETEMGIEAEKEECFGIGRRPYATD